MVFRTQDCWFYFWFGLSLGLFDSSPSGSDGLPSGLFASGESRWAGWCVKLCHIDFRNPSPLCVAGSSFFVASLGPEDVAPDLVYTFLVSSLFLGCLSV